MSAYGTKRTIRTHNVRLWHKADNPTATAFVRYWSNSGQRQMNFAVAAHDLKKQDRRPLRDVVVSLLAEDNQTVTVYANWGDDAATVYSSFTLPEPVAAKDFDANYYRKLLES